jgi:hypothetical protein
VRTIPTKALNAREAVRLREAVGIYQVCSVANNPLEYAPYGVPLGVPLGVPRVMCGRVDKPYPSRPMLFLSGFPSGLSSRLRCAAP